jgi:predicted ATPase
VSAYPDELAAERSAAVRAVEQLRLTPVVGTVAGTGTGHDLLRALVLGCDMFVGVYAERYGERDASSGLSDLEAEYLAATDLPRLVYLREDAPAREPHLAVLVARIQADDTTSYRPFAAAADLEARVADDLALVLTEHFARAEPAPRPAPPPAPEPEPTRPHATTEAEIDRRRPHPRIPRPATALVGRERQVAEVRALLDSGQRLLTLTGTGGIGKTRIAFEVAAQEEADHPDGVWVVDLSGVRDPAVVSATIAQALDIRESAGYSPTDSLKSYLARRRSLLVLDSFELVAAAGPLLVDLLSAVPGLTLLVTSRSVLRIRGEQEYPVPPLELPTERDDGVGPDESPAVRLFLERAAAAAPNVRHTPEDLAAVAAITWRLDGLPLAIELAAARTRILRPEALLSRLEHRLDLLTSGPRDMPERQRTLRATLDWDHELLSAEEQALFRRLGVFARAWTLDLADRVVGPSDVDLVDGLDSLVGKSLVRPVTPTPFGEPRFGMLQTIREYAVERLEQSGEAERLRRAHAVAHMELAERARGEIRGPQQGDHLAELEQAHEELRAALRWADAAVEVDIVLRLAAALGAFWRIHGHFTDGRHWLERALALSAGQRTPLRAELLNAAAFLARARREYDTAEARYREALAIREELGDEVGATVSMRFLGNLGFDRDDMPAAREWWQRSLDRTTPGSNPGQETAVRNNLGLVAWLDGDLDAAETHFAAALAVAESTGDVEQRARVLMNSAQVATDRGDPGRGVELSREAVRLFASLDDTWDMVDAVEALAASLVRLDRVEEAARLYAGADSLRDAVDAPRAGAQQVAYDRDRGRGEERDPEAFKVGYEAGEGAAVLEVVRAALAVDVGGEPGR